jgi:hypothetical protein
VGDVVSARPSPVAITATPLPPVAITATPLPRVAITATPLPRVAITATPLPRVAIARWRAARARRGAAVLMVVLIMTMLMGIGLFAARSAVLATSASGYERQAMQTHYVAQYAVVATTGELSSPRAGSYVKLMALQPDPLCDQGWYATGNMGSPAVPNFTCYRFGTADLQAMVGAARQFFPAQSLDQATKLDGDFLVEMSDLTRSTPVAGMDLTSAGASNLEFVEVTLSATGEVHPKQAGTTVGTMAGTAASLESNRAHIVVGPMPKL